MQVLTSLTEPACAVSVSANNSLERGPPLVVTAHGSSSTGSVDRWSDVASPHPGIATYMYARLPWLMPNDARKVVLLGFPWVSSWLRSGRSRVAAYTRPAHGQGHPMMLRRRRALRIVGTHP
jgi:hypothetical protein